MLCERWGGQARLTTGRRSTVRTLHDRGCGVRPTGPLASTEVREPERVGLGDLGELEHGCYGHDRVWKGFVKEGVDQLLSCACQPLGTCAQDKRGPARPNVDEGKGGCGREDAANPPITTSQTRLVMIKTVFKGQVRSCVPTNANTPFSSSNRVHRLLRRQRRPPPTQSTWQE